jgi:hypothetical protein
MPEKGPAIESPCVRLAFSGRSGRRLALLGAACVALSAAPLCAEEGSAVSAAFSVPSRGEMLVPNDLVEVRWSAACDADADRQENEAELLLSLDGGMSFPIRVSGELSPCASRFTWRVPALPAAQAVLGVRTGEDERDEDERITVVSEAFRILPDPESRVEALYARGAEWWVPEEPTRRAAEDGLRASMRGASSRWAAVFAGTEVAVPAASPASRAPERCARVLPSRPLTIPASTLSLASAPSAPTPLRC